VSESSSAPTPAPNPKRRSSTSQQKYLGPPSRAPGVPADSQVLGPPAGIHTHGPRAGLAITGSKAAVLDVFGPTGPASNPDYVSPDPAGPAQQPVRLTMPTLEERNAKAMAAAGPIYDRINRSWAKAEEHIQKLGVLAPVDMPYNSQGEMTWSLGVQKRNGKWRICHGEFDLRDAERYKNEEFEYDTQWTPISDCNVEIRIAMVFQVKKLIEEVVKTNEKTIPELTQSAVMLESTLKTLGIL
jgi:hypothetical protein